MSLIDYQKEVHKWVSQFNPPYWPPLEMMARLSEETGEVAREINHLYGTKKKKASEDKKELANELKRKEMPAWLSLNKDKLEAKTIGEPNLDEVNPPAEISSIFEFYSR